MSATSDSGSVFTPGTRVRIVRAAQWTAWIGRTGVITEVYTDRDGMNGRFDWRVQIDGTGDDAGNIAFFRAELEPLS